MSDYQEPAAPDPPTELEHDIGWAVAKMRDGYKVTRQSWPKDRGLSLHENGQTILGYEHGTECPEYRAPTGVKWDSLLATDWELAE